MTSIPPLLPDEVFARVLRLARANGISIVIIASVAAIMEAMQRDVSGAIIGLLAAGAGGMEVHGTTLLRWGQKEGMKWLIRGELCLLGVLLAYCALRLASPDLTEMRAAFQATLEFPSMREKWAEAQRLGMTEDQYLQTVYRLTYLLLIFATVIYQGGMTIYYLRRRKAVARALETE